MLERSCATSREELSKRARSRCATSARRTATRALLRARSPAAARSAGYESCASAIRGVNRSALDLYSLHRHHLSASLAAARARVLPRRERRRAHAQPARDRVAVPRAACPGRSILDEAVGRRDVRRTLRKLRRVGLTAAPVGLALRRAYADAGRAARTLEAVATEVVRVPTLNGERGARRAAPSRGRRRDLARQRDHPRGDVLAARRTGTINVHHGAVPEYRGGPPVFWELRDGLDAVGFTIHLIDAGIDTGPVLAAGEVPIERRSTLAETLAATIPAPARGEPRRARAVLDAGAFEGEPQPSGGQPPHDADAAGLPPRPSRAARLAIDRALFLAEDALLGRRSARSPGPTSAIPPPPSPPRASASAPVRKGGDAADGVGDRRGARRGGRDRAAAREPARARLPRRPARARRRVRRVDRRDRRASSSASRSSRACA